ncbi:MAG: AMP-binding protein [Candidatus Thermoplasmatota archaeon]|nr:AMP-binding protein [Candidatus Thermoplasmatota archaeon]
METTIGQLLQDKAEEHPDKEAIIFEDERITYEELNERAERLASFLMKRGIGRDDKVAIWLPNLPEWIIAWFAIPKIGAVVVPTDPWYKGGEIEYMFNDSDTKAVITTEEYGKYDFLDILEDKKEDLDKVDTLIMKEGKSEKFDSFTFEEAYEEGKNWKEDQDYLERKKGTDLDDVTFILYTSGTTGKPKGVMLSHYQIVKNAHDQGEILQTSEDDKLVIPVPFSHCFGNVMSITLMVSFGGTMIPLVEFEPHNALELVEKEEATMIHGVPTMFIRELEALKEEDYDTSSLRTGIMAGSSCPVKTMKSVINDLGCNVSITYGLTEASPGVTMTRFDDSVEDRVETVGRVMPDQEIKTVDDQGNEVEPGETGELLVKGYNVMKGYYNKPEATEETIEDGWLHSGDLAEMDERGYVKIVGRKKDMVIVGGLNVYPREIEEYLIEHNEIQEVAVVGVPDEQLGEVIAAAVVPTEVADITPQDVVDFVYGEIASAKVPRYVTITDSLPVSGRGKVQKFKLRDRLEEKVEEGELEKIIPTEVKK